MYLLRMCDSNSTPKAHPEIEWQFPVPHLASSVHCFELYVGRKEELTVPRNVSHKER